MSCVSQVKSGRWPSCDLAWLYEWGMSCRDKGGLFCGFGVDIKV